MSQSLMREIQVSDAKARLPQILDEVERGETVCITRHGRPIARIVPEPARRQEEMASMALEAIQFATLDQALRVAAQAAGASLLNAP